MSFITWLLAFILRFTIGLIFLLYQIVTKLSQTGIYFKKLAISEDQTCNVQCQQFFNDTLINKNGYKFGNPDETISGVIGKNKRLGTLTKFGKFWAVFLNDVDKNHVENSIEEDEN